MARLDTTMTCSICYKTFFPFRAAVGKFCSRECWRKGIATDPFMLFWSHVRRGDPKECWEWGSSCNSFGYGTLKVRERSWLAHRYSYLIHKGLIPAGLNVLHSCDNPSCVNPHHLSLGTQEENARQMVDRGRCPDRKGNGIALKESQVRVIIDRLYRGEKGAVIARDYNVTPSAIYAIRKGISWVHIPKPWDIPSD